VVCNGVRFERLILTSCWECGGEMKLILENNLPFVTVTVSYQGEVANVSHVLVDTGSEPSY
jgi:hypothetical protein